MESDDRLILHLDILEAAKVLSPFQIGAREQLEVPWMSRLHRQDC